MNREDFLFTSEDGLKIACYRWPAAIAAVGVVQIAHGMGEHALRYAPTAEYLGAAGFHVYANDHRGHGRSAPTADALGDFAAAGWNGLVADMAALTRIIRDREPGLPIVLLGHSMGSFAAQQYLLDYSGLIAGAVISGSATLDRIGISDTSRPVDLSALNAEFEPARTPFDWLSRDSAEVDKYIGDPLCGFGVNARSLATMQSGAMRTTEIAELKRIRRDLPIYIFAGDRDPVNHGLEWLRPLAERYRAAGLTRVFEKYYSGGRHEMLNETNRAEVMRDLLDFLRIAIAA